eukprot:gene14793-20843_t
MAITCNEKHCDQKPVSRSTLKPPTYSTYALTMDKKLVRALRGWWSMTTPQEGAALEPPRESRQLGGKATQGGGHDCQSSRAYECVARAGWIAGTLSGVKRHQRQWQEPCKTGERFIPSRLAPARIESSPGIKIEDSLVQAKQSIVTYALSDFPAFSKQLATGVYDLDLTLK